MSAWHAFSPRRRVVAGAGSSSARPASSAAAADAFAAAFDPPVPSRHETNEQIKARVATVLALGGRKV